jgi:acetoin utilization deacetylase AcuC-like enzyme
MTHGIAAFTKLTEADFRRQTNPAAHAAIFSAAAAATAKVAASSSLSPTASGWYGDCMTVLFTDPLFLRHETGRHPEQPQRLVAITNRLARAGLIAQCRPGNYGPLLPDAVMKVHRADVVARARQVAEDGGGHLDADTILSPDSYQVALAAAGACTAGVDAVMNGPDRTALCLVRPPGHHATPSRSMGFCLFNNIALAAAHGRDKLGLNRILIVDWDVHHGNGTQDVFYADPSVMFCSIHRYGHGFYPGTGAADETGTGAGLGWTLNVPVRHGTSRHDFQAIFQSALAHAADKIRPELVLLSAGFDAHRRDPIGSLGLESEDFAELTRLVLQVADTHAKGRLVSCLEGGYDLDALAESVQVHLEELLAHSEEK